MAKKVEELPPAPPLPAAPHTVSTEDLVKALGSDPVKGFSDKQAQELQNKYGPNQLKPPEKPSPWKLLGRQVANAMTIVLIASMAVSFGTQDWIAGAVILALVILNVSVGFTQEWKAEKTVAALASVGSPTAVVVRDGNTKTLAVEEVVPGDIILVKNGDVVPADARCLPDELSSLETDEALLTGESLPVKKHDRVLDEPDCPVGDRKNMVFSGSQVTKGRGRCLVVNTGMRTELGKIADAMERKETTNHKGWAAKWYKIKVVMGTAGTTPLQIKLNTIAYILLGFALLLAFIVVASTAFTDVPFSIATYAVATAVSILPASLIAVVSLTLANATRELAQRNALVRRMDAVEALGAVTDICSDKTGTITVGKMVVKKAWIPADGARPDDQDWARIDTVTGQAYTAESGSDPFYPRGIVRSAARQSLRPDEDSTSSDDSDDDMDAEDVIRPSEMEEGLKNLVLCASLCNTATIHKSEDNTWEANGDATEIALQVFAHKLGHGQPHLTHTKKSHAVQTKGDALSPITTRTSDTAAVKPAKVALAGHYAKIVEHPFDSTVKRMSTAWKYVSEQESTDDMLIFMKGAVERILDRCTHIGLNPENQVELTDKNRAHIISRMDKLAAEGLRVLALSAKLAPIGDEAEIKAMARDDLEVGFKFVGLVGIYDPPRPASRSAVLECHKAGITPRMLTGDHPATAAAISRAVGIIDANSPASAVMTGQQFDALSEAEIDALPELPLVVARCAPETKVRMVEAIHRRRRYGMQCTTIMTGDGVNDCPALKRADIGFAMGLNGSDVAKGAAEVVLADDQFGTITRAIKKGRGVLLNLSKFLLFLLSGNIAEVLVLLIGLAFQDSTGNAVYPLSPVAALFINTIAAGPPALALGLEPTAWDAMFKSPEAYRTIFTRWWWMDLFFYGILIGSLGVISFVIPVWASDLNGGIGVQGLNCNDVGYDASQCKNIYHGRATCYATVMLLLMLHALECKSAEYSIFQMNLLDNKVLLWSAGICALTTFPILYIPVISDYVFQLVGIGYEWGIVGGCLIAYFVITELWKFARRKMNPDKIAKRPGAEDNEKGMARYDTVADDVFPEKAKNAFGKKK